MAEHKIKVIIVTVKEKQLIIIISITKNSLKNSHITIHEYF